MEETCEICGNPIKVMINRGSGICGENCKSIKKERERS